MVTQFEELTDSQWEVMKDILNCQRKRKHDLREIFNALLWLDRTGTQWRNLESRYPRWTIVYYYFRRWRTDGTFVLLNVHLVNLERWMWDKEATPSLVSVDSQSVKAAPFVDSDKGIDGNKRVNGRKRHIVVDTLGLVVGVSVSAANADDAKEGMKLLERCKSQLQRVQKVLVDGAYKNSFAGWVKEHLRAEAEISSRPETAKGFVPIKWRWVVERTFGWLNFFRRLAKDYEKTAQSAESWILLANCSVILQRFAHWPN